MAFYQQQRSIIFPYVAVQCQMVKQKEERTHDDKLLSKRETNRATLDVAHIVLIHRSVALIGKVARLEKVAPHVDGGIVEQIFVHL